MLQNKSYSDELIFLPIPIYKNVRSIVYFALHPSASILIHLTLYIQHFISRKRPIIPIIIYLIYLIEI